MKEKMTFVGVFHKFNKNLGTTIKYRVPKV